MEYCIVENACHGLKFDFFHRLFYHLRYYNNIGKMVIYPKQIFANRDICCASNQLFVFLKMHLQKPLKNFE